MRTKNTIKNITVSLILGFGVIVINFIAQKIFVDSLGIEYLGLNGLFTNIIAMLAVAELGLGSAIVYHLYAPIHERDMTKVSSIMRFYKTGYRLIALAIVLLGCALIPFLPLIVGDNNIRANITIVYLLFIINAAVSYLLSYKRSILYADQKNYIINSVHLTALVVLNALQIWVLIATHNYYLYLGLRIAATLSENIIINSIVDKKYKLNANPAPINNSTRRDIFTKLKGLLYHKAGSFAVVGSTNIIISIFLGIATVGLYSNYLLIQTSMKALFLQIANAIKASVGNLLVSSREEARFLVFKRLDFAGQVLAILLVSVFLVASDSFVKVWIGEQFVLSDGVVASLALSIYLHLVRWVSFHNFKEAAGIFYEDRFIPIAEAIINIVASIILIQLIGLAGAFIGLALSSLALYAYSYPKYIYKGILGRGYKEYTVYVLQNFGTALMAIGAAYTISQLVYFDSSLLQLLSDSVVAVIVPLLILWVLYKNSEEYIYFKDLITKMLKRTVAAK